MALNGKVAFVTGAARGIGLAIVERLARDGARVAAADIDFDTQSAEVKRLTGEQLSVTALQCDVTERASVEAAVSNAESAYGPIDILVNNAGIGSPVPAELEPLEEFRQVVAVNLTGLFALSQKAGGLMLLNGNGVIINVASILGVVASGQIPQASYASTKGAVVNLTRELAVQWARKGVRVNALAPGWFQTEMTAEMFEDEGALRWAKKKTPMGRTGHENELDGALLFLASDASSFVTGQIVCVDGGWTAV